MKPLPMDWQRVFLGSLSVAIDMGDCYNMSHFISTGEELEGKPQFLPFRAEYDALKARVAEALAYEEIHGEGSRINMEHPINQRLLEMGYPRGPRQPSDVEAL